MAKESLFLCLCQQKSLIFGFCCCFKLDLPSFWGTMTSFDQKMLTQQGLVPCLRKARDEGVAVARILGAARLELQRSSRTSDASTPFFSRGDGRVLSDFRWLLVIWFMKAESNLFCSTRIFFGGWRCLATGKKLLVITRYNCHSKTCTNDTHTAVSWLPNHYSLTYPWHWVIPPFGGGSLTICIYPP
jgi:hypothetical protein